MSGNRRKVILLVHGAGEHKRDALLTTVVNAFANWMDQRGVPADSQMERPKVEAHPDGEGYSSIDLTFGGQSWKFIEVRWADAADPPHFDPLIGWTFQRGLVQIRNLIAFSVNQAVLAFALSVVFLLGPQIVTYALMPAAGLAIFIIAIGIKLLGGSGDHAVMVFSRTVARLATDWVFIRSMRILKSRLKNVD